MQNTSTRPALPSDLAVTPANRPLYQHLIVYPFVRPGARVTSYAVATSDLPGDVVHTTNSKAAAVRWAEKRSASVEVSR